MPRAKPSFAEAAESAVREQLAALAGRSPATDAWYDKHDLVGGYRELVEKLAPASSDQEEAVARLDAALASGTVEPAHRWRVEHLLAVIALDRHLPEEARRHALRAIDAFPKRGGTASPKQSQLPHLVDVAAEATWLLGGAEAAERFFVEWLRANPHRIEPSYSWWRDRFRDEGRPDEFGAFVRRSLGRSWAEELLRRVQETWALVAGRSLDELPFRDKNAFTHDLLNLATILEPSPDELRAAEDLVLGWAEGGVADAHLAWRVSHLRGAIALRLAECERARELHLDAMAAYPDERYAQPAKQSYFQHLLNEAAALTWELRGRESAEDMALHVVATDQRLVYLFEPWWSRRHEESGRPDLGDAFAARLVTAYRTKQAAFPDLAEEVARSMATLEGRVSRLAAGDPEKRYFLHGSAVSAPSPAGHGLAIVLPGGDGGAGFRDFVSTWPRILGEDWLVVQLVAPKWRADQVIVWPTRTHGTAGMRFPTEAFVSAVVDDVRASLPIDPERIVLVGWSSGGPPVQAAMLEPESPFRRALVVMSVFKPATLPPIANARGQSWFLLHSPEDAVCPFAMADSAHHALAAAGARTRLDTYAGAHGWDGLSLERLKEGVTWLVAVSE